MFLLVLIISILSVLSGSVLGVALKKGKFEDFLPLSVLGIILIQYIFGLFNLLNVGFYFTLLAILIIYIFSIYYIVSQSSQKDFIKAFFNFKFLVYIFMILGLVYITHGREITHWDEFTHWGDVVKTMFLNNCLSTNIRAESAFMSYPPAMSLFQYYIEKIQAIFNGSNVFTEWYLYFSYLLLLYSLLFSFLTKLKDNAYLKITLVSLMIAVLPGVIFTDVWSSIYIDPFLGIIGGFGIGYCLIHAQNKIVQYLTIACSTACLILTKDAGISFAIFIIIYYLVYAIHHRQEKRSSRIYLYASLAGAIFAKVSWKLKIIIDGAIVVYGTPHIDFLELLRVMTGRAYENYHWDVFENYIYAVKGSVINICNGWINIGYVGLLLAFALISILLLVLIKKYRTDVLSNIVVIIVSITATITYMIGMCITYMYNFTQYEALKLASFNRYQNIVFTLLLVVLLIQIIDFISLIECKKISSYIVLSLTTLVILYFIAPRGAIYSLYKRDDIQTSQQMFESDKSFSDQCKSLIDSTDANVYYIAQNDFGQKYWSMRYYMRPLSFKSRGSASAFLSQTNDVNTTGIWSVNYTPEQWMDLLVNNYDYVICGLTDDYLSDTFSYLIEGDHKFTDQTLYKVDKKTRRLKIVNN